jgi:REase_AHJR-like
MEPTQEYEENFLQALRNEYESKGYSFHIHPKSDQVPEFLGSYQPDAIATSRREKIVIEVKARRATENEPRLSEIAKLVEKQPGWKFRIYYRGATRANLYDAPKKEEVIQQLGEAENLANSGHLRAAFILAWAALEAAARALNSNEERGRVLMPRELVEWLSYAGYVEPASSRRLRDSVVIRNAIVHGESNVIVKMEDFLFLQAVLRSLIEQIGFKAPQHAES